MRAYWLAPLLLTTACGSRAQRYDTEVQLVRLEVIRRDEQGTPLTMDVEVSFEKCPGEQRKTIRGNKQFAACLASRKPGEMVPAKISHELDEQGEWRPQIVGLAGCDHPLDPNDEASFEIVQVCSDLVVNGVKVGFHCDRKPSKELIDKCPWFRKR